MIEYLVVDRHGPPYGFTDWQTAFATARFRNNCSIVWYDQPFKTWHYTEAVSSLQDEAIS